MQRYFNPMHIKSIGGKVMAVNGVALLITLSVLMTGVFYFVYITESASWRGRQGEAARNAAGTVGSFILGMQNTSSLFGMTEPEHINAYPEETANLIELNPALQEIVYLDSNGKVLASAHKDREVLTNIITIPQSQWFSQAKKGISYLGSIQISVANKPYMIMSMPSKNNGVVAARVGMDVLWEVVQNIHFGQSGQIIVADFNGNILAHTNSEIVTNRIVLSDRFEFQQMMTAPDYRWFGEYTNIQGERVVASTAPVPGTDWVVITELPQDEAFATTRLSVITLGALALVILVVVSLLVARNVRLLIANPMQQLRTGVERIGQGDLNHRINLNREDEIGGLAIAFDMMTRNLQERNDMIQSQTRAALLGEMRYRAIVEDQTELICRYHPDGTLTFVNEAYCRYFGKTREELLNGSFIPLIPEEDRPLLDEFVKSLTPGNPVASIIHRVILIDGEIRWLHWTDRIIFDMEGNVAEYASVGRDITDQTLAQNRLQASEANLRNLNSELEDRIQARTSDLVAEIAERKRAELEIQASLKEKEVLLKEIHHRVKNNLQIISSLLNLQARKVSDAGTLEILRESQNRVRSMSLIHEKLYQSDDLSKVDFSEYVKSLATSLLRSYKSGRAVINLSFELETIYLPIESAIPCGLIVNELVTNSLKYAFPDDRKGTIKIEIRETEGKIVNMVMSDNGVGLPPGLDPQTTGTLGLKLVHNLTIQLDGSLEINNENGASFKISFPPKH